MVACVLHAEARINRTEAETDKGISLMSPTLFESQEP